MPCRPPALIPPPARRLRTPALLIAAGALCTGSAWADGARPAAGPADPMARVQQLIGDATCRSDADCRTIGVGHRACGGPQAYLPWSSRRTPARDVGALEAAAAATRTAPARTTEPMMSSCQVAVDPGARCVGAVAGSAGAPSRPGRCQLREAAPPVR